MSSADLKSVATAHPGSRSKIAVVLLITKCVCSLIKNNLIPDILEFLESVRASRSIRLWVHLFLL
jgi:hypothetical protein